MTPEEFCRWLQGFVELHGAEVGNHPPTEKQWRLIREHLQLLYKKETSNLEDVAKAMARSTPPGRIC